MDTNENKTQPQRRSLLSGTPPLGDYDRLVADLIVRMDEILQKPAQEGTLNYYIPDWHISNIRVDIRQLAQHLINRGVAIEEY